MVHCLGRLLRFETNFKKETVSKYHQTSCLERGKFEGCSFELAPFFLSRLAVLSLLQAISAPCGRDCCTTSVADDEEENGRKGKEEGLGERGEDENSIPYTT